jgi:mannose-6-phosphate isomerase-like protein (cupin superfamily)
MSTTTTAFGAIVNSISGLGDTHELLGGVGTCRWKQLINGMHLNGPWNCVEYVVIPPGASCGLHTHHATEEIYYILSGAAEMDMNGEPVALTAGDLVTAPIGTSHGTVNDGLVDMEFLVVEVFPGAGSAPPATRIAVCDVNAGGARVSHSHGGAGVAHAADLAGLFTGPWQTFEAIELTPASRLERPRSDGDEVLFVADGSARIEYGSATVEGGRGLCVGIPPAVDRSIVNTSDRNALQVLSTVVGLGD